ncbi:GEVED domain-containing protein [Flavobacterium selenitireducens]|uniref:GEVED domain-containing protein n=1 Tax=Flavobacterium selenitireducens TaxID=2722704 RepID=UPI00168A545F|nr:GEVED domain-containing protein [Flavobacterium selenitireducens]MBD3582702.1 fibronectin type III domain-containing protein [Flavobacterium selenitireducens]
MIKTLPVRGEASLAVFRWFLLLSILSLLFVANSNAQVSVNYSFSEMAATPAYSALNPATKTILFASPWNDQTPVSTPIGFSFVFNGTTYTNTVVSPNGFLILGGTTTGINYNPIAGNNIYNGVIAAYSANLQVTTTSAATSIAKFLDTSGGAGNYILKIEYPSFRKSTAETGGYMSMQIWLYETTNVIEFHYTSTGTFNSNTTGQVGLRGTSSADYNKRVWAGNTWPTLPATSTAATVNTIAASDNWRTAINSSIPGTSNTTLRWTPVSCPAPGALAVTPGSVTLSGATLTWTGSASSGFQYYYNTTGTAPNAATTPTGTSATNSATISSMAAGSNYYVWVRANCVAGDLSAWTGPVNVSTLCAPVSEEYFNYFEEISGVSPLYNYNAPAIQPCHGVQSVNGNNWYTADVGSAVDGIADEHLQYNGNAQVANAWWFTQGVTLTAGKTYQLNYLYAGSTDFNFLTNKMKVMIGTAPHSTFMTTTLDDHPNIKHAATANHVNFTVASSGTYYVGFQAYSVANMGKIFIDDVELVEGICMQPAVATASSVAATSATLMWTAPTPAPALGYAYYVSTSATPPTNHTIPTGFTGPGTTLVNLAGLSGNTAYYFWVRGYCSAGDFSIWSGSTTFTTAVLPPYCMPTTTQSSQAYISNVSTTGAVQNINNSSAWVAPGNSDYTAQTIIQSQGQSFNFSVGLDDGNASPGIYLGVGVGIWIDWNNDGDFADAGEIVYNTTSYTGSNQGTVTGTIAVPLTAPLGVTRMRVFIDYADSNPTDNANDLGCLFNGSGELEDYSIKIVTPPPALVLSAATSTQCALTNSPNITITQGLSDYNTFVWTPSGVTGTAAGGYTFNAGSTVTYTLTATQTVAPFSVNTAQFTYVANVLPTPITITTNPTGATMCEGGTAMQLSASGGVVSGLPILSENFNSGAPGWTTTNTGTPPATAANGSWTIRPDGFTPTGPTWGWINLHSNDASPFYFSDSDAQGVGSTTRTELISPVFSLENITAASLSFWHFYDGWINGNGFVEISTNGGATYTTLVSYSSLNQGTPGTFAHVVRDLGAYLGQTNLRIKFRYSTNWGWGWAIDNFLVSGNATSAITWSPTTGLYNDAAHTIPYTGTGAASVYAWPTTTTTYTASASTPSPVCSTTTLQTVTVTPLTAGTISANQNVCSGTVEDLILTGQIGTVGTWQSANDAAFTTPVNIAGSAGLTTLTSAVLGPINATTYIRVQVSNGTCTAYTNTVTLSVESTTWDGTSWNNGAPNLGKRAVFAGNYISSGDLSACSVGVTSGNVSFEPGHSLIVENGVNVSGGALIFESESSLVQISDSGVNTGSITYKRETTPMRNYDYTYWSSPLNGTTLDDVSPDTRFDKYHHYNVPTGQFLSIPDVTVMTPGRGYIMRAPAGWPNVPTSFTAVMTMGPANNGVITYPVAMSAPATNLNLLGNPYPSALDADEFITHPTNAGLINGTLYFWTHNTPITNQVYNNNDYASYNLLGATAAANSGSGNNSAPTKNIAAGNAFFVTAIANGTAVFNNSMRLAGFNDNFYRPGSAAALPSVLEKHRIWLDMSNSDGAFKQALVGYATNATSGLDREYDGKTIESLNSISFYSILDENKLTIQGRALPFDENDQVAMGYRANVAGNYSIALSAFDGLFADENQHIYLEDLVLGTIHDLKSGAYGFATATGEFPGRFVLRFTGEQLQVGDPIFNQNSVVVFGKDEVIRINSGNVAMESVKIFDTRGRLIAERKNIGSTQAEIANLGIANQVLIVQVTSVDQITVSKKIIY